MNEVFEQSVIQPLTSLSEKARPGRPRKPSHVEPFVLEQWAFVLALNLKRRTKQ